MRVEGPASGHGCSDPDAFSSNRAMALPFLPTLFTAVAIAALSLLCRQPAPSELPPPAAMTTAAVSTPKSASAIDGFQRATEWDGAAAIPATLAFGQLFPLTPDAPVVAEAARPVSPRVASATKRGCAGGRCDAKRIEPVRSAANPPRPEAVPPLPFVAREDDDTRPTGALPFAPTAAAVVDSVRALGTDAATLGSSVLGAVAVLR